jgi:hypothetical protein
MASKGGWSRRFDDPIALPGGRQLVTLENAGNYITKLLSECSTPIARIIIPQAGARPMTKAWPPLLLLDFH